MRSDLRAVWLVRSRAVSAKLRFWMLLAGLESRPLTLNDRLYLIYALAFFALWALALLTLLAGFAAGVLALLPADPAEVAAAIVLIGLLVWALSAAWGAARRSPIAFSEADAQHLCQTPVSRRGVALIWLLTDWPLAALPVAVVALVLGYAQVEVALGADIGMEHLPQYLASGLRALSTTLPLHLGLMSLVWAMGAYRLEGDRERPWLRWLPLAAGAALVASLVITGGGQPLAGLFSPTWQAITAPLTIPLLAGMGAATWTVGLSVSLAVAVGSLLLLTLASADLSLSRAAQETRGLEALRTAVFVGIDDLATEVAQRQRLGVSRQPTRLPGRPGAAAFTWKRIVQMGRTLNLSSAATWLMMAAAAALMAVAPDPGTQAWSALLWVYSASLASARPLRNDLGRWWLFRQMPESGSRVLLGSLSLSVLLTTIVSLAAPLVAALRANPAWLPLLLALPGASAAAALAGTVDILRRCRAPDLIAGIVPGTTSLTLLIGLGAVALPIVTYAAATGLGAIPAALAAGAASLAVAILLGRLAARYLVRVA